MIGTVKILLTNIETLPTRIERERISPTLHMLSPLVNHPLHAITVDLEGT